MAAHILLAWFLLIAFLLYWSGAFQSAAEGESEADESRIEHPNPTA